MADRWRDSETDSETDRDIVHTYNNVLYIHTYIHIHTVHTYIIMY